MLAQIGKARLLAGVATLTISGAFATAQAQTTTIQGPVITLPSTNSSDPRPNAPELTTGPRGALDCSITPSRTVSISSSIDGVLRQVHVRPGQSVAAGDLIASIDTDIAAAELELSRVRANTSGALKVAQARVNAATTQFNVQNLAYKNKVASKVDFERARGELQVARQQVSEARENQKIAAAEQARMEVIVSKGEIRTPVAGVVGEDMLNPAEAIDGQPIAEIIVLDPMRVEVFAPIETARRMSDGADYVLVSRLDDPVMADVELDYVSPVADSSSQTIRVYFHLTDPNVAPGYRCFLTKRADAEAFLAERTKSN